MSARRTERIYRATRRADSDQCGRPSKGLGLDDFLLKIIAIKSAWDYDLRFCAKCSGGGHLSASTQRMRRSLSIGEDSRWLERAYNLQSSSSDPQVEAEREWAGNKRT